MDNLKKYDFEIKTVDKHKYICREITKTLPAVDDVLSCIAVEAVQDFDQVSEKFSVENINLIISAEIENLFSYFVQDLNLEYPFLEFSLNTLNENEKIFWCLKIDDINSEKENELIYIFFLALESFLKPYCKARVWANIVFKSA